MLEAIKRLLADVWDLIKKIFVAVVRFVQNIVSFFRDPSRLRKLQEDQNRIAVSIKEKLDNGDYQVVNCLYDKADERLVSPETDCEAVTSQQLDKTTKDAFGDKDMLVVQ